MFTLQPNKTSLNKEFICFKDLVKIKSNNLIGEQHYLYCSNKLEQDYLRKLYGQQVLHSTLLFINKKRLHKKSYNQQIFEIRATNKNFRYSSVELHPGGDFLPTQTAESTECSSFYLRSAGFGGDRAGRAEFGNGWMALDLLCPFLFVAYNSKVADRIASLYQYFFDFYLFLQEWGLFYRKKNLLYY